MDNNKHTPVFVSIPCFKHNQVNILNIIIPVAFGIKREGQICPSNPLTIYLTPVIKNHDVIEPPRIIINQ